ERNLREQFPILPTDEPERGRLAAALSRLRAIGICSSRFRSCAQTSLIAARKGEPRGRTLQGFDQPRRIGAPFSSEQWRCQTLTNNRRARDETQAPAGDALG